MSTLETPSKCTADFCLIPLGTPTASVSQQIADVQRLLKQSGIKYSMHSAGTTIGKSVQKCISIRASHLDILFGAYEDANTTPKCSGSVLTFRL
jgi:uncharacterized protein (TIGR00106 family)